MNVIQRVDQEVMICPDCLERLHWSFNENSYVDSKDLTSCPGGKLHQLAEFGSAASAAWCIAVAREQRAQNLLS